MKKFGSNCMRKNKTLQHILIHKSVYLSLIAGAVNLGAMNFSTLSIVKYKEVDSQVFLVFPGNF